MNGSSFTFDHVQLLYYKGSKKNPNCGGSYIDSPDWIKNKKPIITLINKNDNKYFKYPKKLALNNKEIIQQE